MPGRKKDDRRERALMLYWRSGKNLSSVSREEGMPNISTLSLWKKEDEWDNKVIELQEKFKEILSTEKSLIDRLEFSEDLENYQFVMALKRLAADGITTSGLVPTSYKEILDTLKFVFEQERLMTGRPTDRKQITIERIEKMSDKELDDELDKGTKILSSSSAARKDTAVG